MDNTKVLKVNVEISNLRWKSLEKIIRNYLKSNKKVYCKWLNKRPIFIDEYLYFIDSRNSWDKNHRKKAFFAWIYLIKNVQKENITNTKKNWWKISYEFKWITPNWNLIWVHIVEFITKKDKKLKLISTFWEPKKA